MKILLLGEFSGLHKNLQVGLRAAGHHVDLASSGDGYKEIFGEITPPRLKNYHPWSKIRFRYDYFNFLKGLHGYDVVQLINVNALLSRWFPYKSLIRSLKQSNGKIFLLAAGSDAFYWQKSRKSLKYGPFEDVLEYDIKNSSIHFQTRNAMNFAQYIADNVDGIIPIAYDYAVGYRDFTNLKETIPLPIDVASIDFKPGPKNRKLNIFHGLSRYGFKGSRHVESAFRSLEKTHGECLAFEINGGMPLSEYLNTLADSNIVVDQVNSYSYGMNAIYAAAMGKIVLSGAEPECLNELGVESCPIVNAMPDSRNIQSCILNILEKSHDLHEWSERSRIYIENIHCCYRVAAKFLNCWTATSGP